MTDQTLSTRFPAIDKLTGGFEPGTLHVLAGRSGMGKSALAMNIAENASLDTGVPVAVFNKKTPAHRSSNGRLHNFEIDWRR